MDSTRHPPACDPTWIGHIRNTRDALIVFQACVNGQLFHCARRPYNRERKEVIRSGHIFVYEEESSGIQRWTDGVPWSPSRVLNNFLIYRQLKESLAPGEKRRATKRSLNISKRAENFITQTFTMYDPLASVSGSRETAAARTSARQQSHSPERDADRELMGSLVDSYDFEVNGLFKKTMTVSVCGVHYHLIAYYTLEDAKTTLRVPSEDEELKHTVISDHLRKQPKFEYRDEGDTSVVRQVSQPANPYINAQHVYTTRPPQNGQPDHPHATPIQVQPSQTGIEARPPMSTLRHPEIIHHPYLTRHDSRIHQRPNTSSSHPATSHHSKRLDEEDSLRREYEQRHFYHQPSPGMSVHAYPPEGQSLPTPEPFSSFPFYHHDHGRLAAPADYQALAGGGYTYPTYTAASWPQQQEQRSSNAGSIAARAVAHFGGTEGYNRRFVV